MREEERRNQIMKAAETLFASGRFHEITTEDIAAKAGVGKGTLYRYFKDKDDLFHQTVMAGFEELCTLLEAEDPGNAPLEPRLIQICRHIDSFVQSRRRLFGLMQAEEHRLELKRGRLRQHFRDRRQRLTGIIADILSQAVTQGELRLDIPPQQLASLLVGMLKSISHDSGAGQDTVAQVVSLFLYGAHRRETDA